ncbi:MAG: THUMP-like domain-containing protein [Flavobacteriales bacterium]
MNNTFSPLTEEEKQCIEEFGNQNPKDLYFKANQPQLSFKKVAAQIEKRQKLRKKLPTWTANLDVFFPHQLALEQCSSEALANYKASKIEKGTAFIDLTGGFGLDAWAFSSRFESSIYVEQQSDLVELAKHNFNVLDANIQVVEGNGIDVLTKTNSTFDLIYLDPARRKQDKKVFRLEDCEPNLIEHQDVLLSKTKLLMAKHSPLVDLDYLKSTLKHLIKIEVLALHNECKEILTFQSKSTQVDFETEAINLINNDLTQTYKKTTHPTCAINSEPKTYIYIPNVALLKAQMSEQIAVDFKLSKFATSCHFYLSDDYHKTYPGRCFKVESVFDNLKDLKKKVKGKRREVICKHAVLTPEELKKKTALRFGSDEAFVLAGKNQNQKMIYFDCIRQD